MIGITILILILKLQKILKKILLMKLSLSAQNVLRKVLDYGQSYSDITQSLLRFAKIN